MLGAMVIGVVNGMMMAQAEHEAFEAQLAAMPKELREDARKRRSDAQREAREERRHREMVEATRSKNHGPLAFLFGFILGHA